MNNDNVIDQFFKYKSNVFKDSLKNLTAQKMLDNLAAYKELKRIERLETIEYMKSQIDNMYSDEKIKEEKLLEYTQGLTRELKRTSYIKLFAETLRNYMPKYNELKHFNALKVATAFLNYNKLSFNSATMTTIG